MAATAGTGALPSLSPTDYMPLTDGASTTGAPPTALVPPPPPAPMDNASSTQPPRDPNAGAVMTRDDDKTTALPTAASLVQPNSGQYQLKFTGKDPILQHEAKQSAERLLTDVEDNTTPWCWTIIPALCCSLYAATSISSSTDYFANRLLNGDKFKSFFDKHPNWKSGLRWGTTLTSAATTGALSINTNFNKWNHIFRTLFKLQGKDLGTNIIPLLLTAFSSLVSQKQAIDAFKDNPALGKVFGYGRMISALGTNGTFALQFWKNLMGLKKKPITALIYTVMGPQGILMNDLDDGAFLETLQSTQLLKILSTKTPLPKPPTHLTDDAKAPGNSEEKTDPSVTKVNEIVSALLAIYEKNRPSEKLNLSIAPQFGKKEVALIAFSLFSYLSNYTTGTEIPTDVWNMDMEDGLTKAAGIGLGALMGGSSTLVNAAIGTISSAKEATKLYNAWQTRECRRPKCGDFGTAIKLICAFGYALAQAGTALEYPFLGSETCGWFQFAVSLGLNTALGDYSINSFLLSLENGWYLKYEKLLERALNAKNLKVFYGTIDDPVQKSILIRLLKDYIQWAADPLINFANTTADPVMEYVLSSAHQEKLSQLKPTPEEEAAQAKASPSTKRSSTPTDAKAPASPLLRHSALNPHPHHPKPNTLTTAPLPHRALDSTPTGSPAISVRRRVAAPNAGQ